MFNYVIKFYTEIKLYFPISKYYFLIKLPRDTSFMIKYDWMFNYVNLIIYVINVQLFIY